MCRSRLFRSFFYFGSFVVWIFVIDVFFLRTSKISGRVWRLWKYLQNIRYIHSRISTEELIRYESLQELSRRWFVTSNFISLSQRTEMNEINYFVDLFGIALGIRGWYMWCRWRIAHVTGTQGFDTSMSILEVVLCEVRVFECNRNVLK